MCTSNVSIYFFFFFFNDTATTEIYTLSLHDALPILYLLSVAADDQRTRVAHSQSRKRRDRSRTRMERSEEHTSELQSRLHLVCRLLLEKKKYNNIRLRYKLHVF